MAKIGTGKPTAARKKRMSQASRSAPSHGPFGAPIKGRYHMPKARKGKQGKKVMPIKNRPEK